MTASRCSSEPDAADMSGVNALGSVSSMVLLKDVHCRLNPLRNCVTGGVSMHVGGAWHPGDGKKVIAVSRKGQSSVAIVFVFEA